MQASVCLFGAKWDQVGQKLCLQFLIITLSNRDSSSSEKPESSLTSFETHMSINFLILPIEEDLIIFLAISFTICHTITSKFSVLRPQSIIISSRLTGAHPGGYCLGLLWNFRSWWLGLVPQAGSSGMEVNHDSRLPWISVLLHEASPHRVVTPFMQRAGWGHPWSQYSESLNRCYLIL